MILTLLIGLDALLFPVLVQKEMLYTWWILSLGILILAFGLTGLRNRSQEQPNDRILLDNDLREKVKEVIEEEVIEEEVIEEEVIEEEVIEEEVIEEEVIEEEVIEEEVIEEEVIEEVVIEEGVIKEDSEEKIENDEKVEDEDEEHFDAVVAEEAKEVLDEKVDEISNARVEKEFIYNENKMGIETVNPENPLGIRELSLEEILEKGFQAKENRDNQQAASWFIKAIERKPSPDITFYLIIDSFSLWKEEYSDKEATEKMTPYILRYNEVAPLEWRQKLMEWFENEKSSG